MHILFALPGLHRVNRGAEVALESVALEIARRGKHQVTVAGSGQPIEGRPYKFRHVPNIQRSRFEAWPKLPFLRNEFMYEDLTFATGLARKASFGADLTITCNYPYTSWALRKGGPRFVFVTQNGDWPARNGQIEARLFHCDGLVCTNPIYFSRNKDRWPSALIPNGLDPERFHAGAGRRAELGLPQGKKLVLMVSALEPGKRVIEAMRAVALVKDAFLVVAGDGPQRQEVDQLAAEMLPGRFMRATFPRDVMPDLYRSADLFLHTKIEESFGNVYIEALSSGLPIVAHDDEVTRWILGDRATLVDTRSTEGLAAAITQSLGGPRGDAADAVSWAHGRYAWAEVARQYEEFFEATLARPRAG
jgi:glycosyltransferase involved in cell wall biosynthesis